jgi:peptide/nickel transport system substrate-binding protein
MKKSVQSISWLVFAALSIVMNACGQTPSSSKTPTIPTEIVIPTPTQPEKRVLTICLGEEPASLYIYKGNSHSMWSVLEAIYDGPIDIVKYQGVPVILEKIPNFTDQSAIFQPTAVVTGDVVIDIHGNPINLAKGSQVFPSGCSDESCAITWDGKTTLSMDRIVANYSIKTGILWSDGTALTASDSVYSYKLASDPATPVIKHAISQTASYLALDDRTIQWTSKPGMITRYPEDYFWIPLPEHLWKGFSASQLLTAPESNQKPVGWGAYTIDEWVPGDHIRLVKNSNYFRAGEGLPKFDVLVYRFIGNQTTNNISAIKNSECDVVDQTTLWEGQYQAARQAQLDKKVSLYVGSATQWEHLDFNISPASYDNGFNAALDRPDFFGDKRVRQAFAYCMDREATVKAMFNSLASVPNSYLPQDFPLYDATITILPFDITLGTQLLDQVGWKDTDNDPATPRVAQGVKNVVDGTLLSIDYLTTTAELRKSFAQAMATSLAQCGIQVNLDFVTRDKMYATAPDGILFGRNYDLAEFAWGPFWEPFRREPPCFLYTTAEIPTAANQWMGETHGGVNIAGYSNPDYDKACQAASDAGMNLTTYQQSELDAMKILADDLPSIPLFNFIQIAASRPDLCGMSMDTSARSEFWNLENLDYGLNCTK